MMGSQEADSNIMKLLKQRGNLIVQSQLKHSYPFCWRCAPPLPCRTDLRSSIVPMLGQYRSGTPLIYRAIPSWFVRVQQVTDQLVANNRQTRWVPANVGENRFQNWIANARDWNVSRNRYWGTPLPVWVSDDLEEVRRGRNPVLATCS